MFTGLIEEVGTIRNIKRGTKSCILTVGCKEILKGTKVGDSIATNGVCLTVTGMGSDYYTADVMSETLNRSSLGQLQTGSRVNTERAMAADGRFGGHIVSGHIDGTGTVVAIAEEDNAVWYTIAAGPELLRYIVLPWHMWMNIALKYPSFHIHDRRPILWTGRLEASSIWNAM